MQTPAIRIVGEIVNIDWLNFIVPSSCFVHDINSDDQTEYMQARVELDAFLTQIFGSHVTEKRGYRNFYDHTLVIGEGWGFVLHGGQRNTICFMLTGTGCGAFQPGWETRLYERSKSLRGSYITRVDLAHDDLHGVRGSIYDIDLLEKSGQFTWAGHERSEVTKNGNWDHGDPRNKGLTLYVGSTSSGKRLCCYEKGKQLGCSESPWVRYELRFSNKDRILPWTILDRPSHYFAAGYPLFEGWADRVERIEIKKRATSITYADCKRIVKRQFGQYLSLILEIDGIDGIHDVCRDGVPARVRQFTTSINTQPPRFSENAA